MKSRGFHWFVAMRYLRGAQYSRGAKVAGTRGTELAKYAAIWSRGPFGAVFSKLMRGGSTILLILTGVCAAALATFLVWRYAFLEPPRKYHPLDPWLQRTELGAIISGALMVIIGTLAVLRKIFSFNSTVSMFGVWIGTMALVFVLSVMSGFETDLRQKILGSNAHIQISKVEGDFTDWEEVRDKIKTVPGVVASTPFAVSEVVIAANNNYFNVIIKGIDPESIGTVTQLMSDLQCDETDCSPAEAREVMKKLEPEIDDDDLRNVPQPDDPDTGSGDTTDEAPPDMVEGTDPIDFSGGADEEDEEEEEEEDEDEPPPTTPKDEDDDFGGTARHVLGYDAAPGDGSAATEDDEDDAGGPSVTTDDDGGRTIQIEPSEFSPPSRRTKLLDGVLVGKELTKQIHLYEGQEVRLVSPMSDPANPDATGTPIPYNKDYRIAGTFFTGMYEYDLKFVYVTLDSLQTFLDRGDAVDGIEVRIDDPDETSAVLAAIQKRLGKDYKVADWQELNRSLFSALKLEKIAMFLVLAIIILVASFSIVGNLVMVVVEKGKEIALLKTLGASDRGVTWVFITQGFFIGLIGTGLGVTLGLTGCYLAKRFGIPINPDVYYIDRLPIHVDISSVLLIAAAGVVISVGATVYPAMVASRLAPSVGLRH
jgi:lipoprotein-releasing system permease protein